MKDPRGYWRLSHWPNLGESAHVIWFDYDDKDVAEIVADESYKKLAWKKSVIELDMQYEPNVEEEPDEDAWWKDL